MSVALAAFDGDEFLPFPDFEILEEQDRDGFTINYRARQRSMNRIVTLRTGRSNGQNDFVNQGLALEASILARLDHPSIIPLFELRKFERQVFLVLKYVGGGNLATLISEKPLELQSSVQLVEKLARSLAIVHESGYLHCDLKPRKILLESSATASTNGISIPLLSANQGWPVLTGFEFAREVSLSAKHSSGEIRGTPSYMAPEQALGRDSEIGPATDIHGLGTILYELLTGQPPFRAPTVYQLLQQIIDEQPKTVRKLRPDVPAPLEKICHKCLLKDPKKRFQSASHLADALQDFLRDACK